MTSESLNPSNDDRAMAVCNEVMQRYHVRDDVRRLILRRCIFTCDNYDSKRGGGRVYFGYHGAKTWIHINTVQHEAALHEIAHAVWFEMELIDQSIKNQAVKQLIAEFLKHANYPQAGPYKRVRELCHDYRYGHPVTDGYWPGMWMAEYSRWNHDEIFAGLASGVMGDMTKMPAEFHDVYQYMFDLPQTVHLPLLYF